MDVVGAVRKWAVALPLNGVHYDGSLQPVYTVCGLYVICHPFTAPALLYGTHTYAHEHAILRQLERGGGRY